tara:strand:- start:55 stop:258 length:204 start_codon:yes stop_codon:yes gene_type:complete
MNDKILNNIHSYDDIISDLKDVWYDLNGILDYEDKREKDILDGLKSIINGFDKELFKTTRMIEDELK